VGWVRSPGVAVHEVAARGFDWAMPEIDVVGGTAEAIPLAGRTADAVVAAQAFHWFSGAEALSEIHRVLRPGGGHGLVLTVPYETRLYTCRARP
jgi:ubiquinone/menaquinone biosynthesis C-methylase UbiE